MSVRRPLCAAAGIVVLSAARDAYADDTPSRPIDAEVTSDTAAQMYEIRSPSGQTVIGRRRLTTTLGASAYNLLDKPANPMAPTLTFRARLRYDADYGGNSEETAPNRLDRLVPGFSRGPVDLMYGYIEGRRFINGLLNFKLGRQYVTDALGWWSFDGGHVQIVTPYYVAVEAYGGLEQRGGLPFSTPRYEREGVWRGDRTDYDASAYPSFQPNNLSPAVGVAVESTGLTWLHGRATYRRVYNTGASNASQFANGVRAPVGYDGTRISQERIGYAVDGVLPELGGIKAGFAYDLYVKTMANIFASVDWYTSKKVTLSLDYDFYRPTFDADSIWNFFMAMPMNDLAFRASWDPNARLSVAGNLHARLFGVQTQPESGVTNTSPNGLGSANYYPTGAIASGRASSARAARPTWRRAAIASASTSTASAPSRRASCSRAGSASGSGTTSSGPIATRPTSGTPSPRATSSSAARWCWPTSSTT